MKKILFISYRWNDSRLKDHSSDRIMSFGFSKTGWQVRYYDYRESETKFGKSMNQEFMYRKIMEINPDVIFITKGEKVSPETIIRAKKNGFKGIVIGWYNDVRREPVKCVVDIMKVCDWFFHCIGGDNLKQYYNLTKTPTSFLFAPFNHEFINIKNFENRSYKLSWYGQLYKPEQGFDDLRRTIIPSVRDLLDDYGACFDRTFFRGDEYYSKLGNSLMSLSIPAIDIPMYFSNRHSHIMGSGTVPLSYRFKNLSPMFTDGYNIITFKDADELRKQYNYYLNNLDELQTISNNVFVYAYQYMHYYKVFEEIMYVLRNGKSSYPFGETINPEKRKIIDYA